MSIEIFTENKISNLDPQSLTPQVGGGGGSAKPESADQLESAGWSRRAPEEFSSGSGRCKLLRGQP
jgi:hypothetical protein